MSRASLREWPPVRRVLAAFAIVVLAAPAYAAGQHPAASARPHPASGAHAVAAAAEASARRIEACGERSAALLAALGKDDYAAATADFDAQMKSLLGPQKLAATWTAITAQFGKLQSLGPAQSVMYGDDPMVVTPVRFEKAGLTAQVACDADGRIAGFHLQPTVLPPATSG